MFKAIEESEALIVSNGVYKPARVYEGPGGGLFVQSGSGFVRVKENGYTSSPTVRVELLHHEATLYRDRFGRLCATAGEGRKPMRVEASEDTMKLIEKE